MITNLDTPPRRRRVASGIRPQDPTWWLWAGIASLLGADLCGISGAREIALAVFAAKTVAGLRGDPTPRHFRVQVQGAYLAILALGFAPGLGILAWIQFAGTLVLVLTGYCPLARSLLLLPLNRSVPLTPSVLRRILLTPPTTGSVVEELDLHAAATVSGPASVQTISSAKPPMNSLQSGK